MTPRMRHHLLTGKEQEVEKERRALLGLWCVRNMRQTSPRPCQAALGSGEVRAKNTVKGN